MMKVLVRLWVALSLLAWVAACSSNSDSTTGRGTVTRGSPQIGAPTGSAEQPASSGPIGGNQPMNTPVEPSSTAGAGPDNGLGECGQVTITPQVEFRPGNLLIIFDRSMSMSTPFPDPMSSMPSRLDNAKQAINTALAPLVCPDVIEPDGPGCTDPVNVALLTFPTYDGVSGRDILGLSCSVDLLESEEQISWRGVTQFAKDFDPYWASRTLVDGAPLYPGMHPLSFGTPISVAFARAAQALMDPSLTGNKAVLFLTDGEEVAMCADGVNGIVQAQQWFSGMGIRTHVLSLAPPGGLGQVFNDGVALGGGTGASIYPTDSAQLTDEISKIVFDNRGQTTCEITIDDAALTDPVLACDEGEVFVQSTKVPCDRENKAEGFWVKDAKSFEIVGSYCTLLQETMSLRAGFPCALLM